MQGKSKKADKSLAPKEAYYRYSNDQISLSEFKQPVGMHLKESNRWVKRAQAIPWLDIEKRYASLFTNRKGNAAKPLLLALGTCIIQAEYDYSDEETALQIQENAYLQYFCRYLGYDVEKPPFDPSLMVYFRKRLTPEVHGEINKMILQDAKERQNKENKDDDSDDDSDNSGTMIVDATCAPSNVRYPQNVSLLGEVRENAEKLLDSLHDHADGKKPRTYRKRARKDYLKYTKCRKHTAKMTRKSIQKQLNYLDECERVEVERMFSFAKRKCGMWLAIAKLRETAAHVIAMSILLLNLRKIQRTLLRILAELIQILMPKGN